MSSKAPSRLSRRTNRAKPPKRSLVHAFYYIDGVPYIDAMPIRGGGQLLRRVPLLQHGGGRDVFFHVPVGVPVPVPVPVQGQPQLGTSGSPQMQAFNRKPDPATSPHAMIVFDDDGAPAAIGLIPRRQSGAVPGQPPMKGADEDQGAQHGANEFHLSVGNASFGLTSYGGWHFQTGDAATFDVQVRQGGRVRFSHDGQAEDGVAVGGATEDYVAKMAEIMNNQTETILALLNALSGTNAASAAAAASAVHRPDFVEPPHGRFASKLVRISGETVAGSPISDPDPEA